jgi:hypothetical protein
VLKKMAGRKWFITLFLLSVFLNAVHPKSSSVIDDPAIIEILSPKESLYKWPSSFLSSDRISLSDLRHQLLFSLNIDLESVPHISQNPWNYNLCRNSSIQIKPLCFDLIKVVTDNIMPNLDVAIPSSIIHRLSRLEPVDRYNVSNTQHIPFKLNVWLEEKNGETDLIDDNISHQTIGMVERTIYLQHPSPPFNPADFTAIVQGPLSAQDATTAARSIEACLSVVSRVVVSCWSGDELEWMLPLLRKYRDRLTLVSQPLPFVPPTMTAKWETTTLYQFTSTLTALRLVNTK